MWHPREASQQRPAQMTSAGANKIYTHTSCGKLLARGPQAPLRLVGCHAEHSPVPRAHIEATHTEQCSMHTHSACRGGEHVTFKIVVIIAVLSAGVVLVASLIGALCPVLATLFGSAADVLHQDPWVCRISAHS